jgi:glycosyltransferase involved in cell wall biosynthesis
VEVLRAKARVLPLGLDLARFDVFRPAGARTGPALVLWNHRWEYDKAPAAFFAAIYALADERVDFKVILLGESFRNQPAEFLEARRLLGERIVHFGFAEDPADYARLLWQADIVASTAIHEFFGAAVVEACYCGCFPVLPRRLSYPELIPRELHAACLYDEFEGLLARLRHAILDVEQVRCRSLQVHMARYDWQQMAPEYDTRLAEVSLQGPSLPGT